MRLTRILLLTMVVLGLAFSGAFAMKHLPEERGKALFNDTTLGGGTAGKSCNSCHPNGKGLESAGAKTEWKTPGGVHKSLEEAVNTCITMALKGRALDPQSAQMKDIVAYIKSLKGMKMDSKPKKKKAIEGC